MAQISYGTITITDTTDIESITIEYARNQDPTTAPSGSNDWGTTQPEWAEGYYIWQRTRIHKYGTSSSSDSIGVAVCITGSQGETGRSLTSTVTQYTTAANSATITTSNMDNYTWYNNIPAYNSSTPVYWVRVANTYSNPSSGYLDVYNGEVADGSSSSSSSSSSSGNNSGNNVVTVYIIYKDEGLTSAVAMSQNALTTSQNALTQASSNINTIIRLWYRSNSATAPGKPSAHVTESSNNVDNTWTTTKPIDKNGYRYYYYCDELCTASGTYSWTNVVLDTSNLSQYEIGALTTKVKNFWWDSDGAHVASGKNGNEVTTSSALTYGYNSLMGLTGISFGYDNTKVIDLTTTSPALSFYLPPAFSNSVASQGNKVMQLSGNALTFYNPSDGTTAYATLDVSGLKLVKGGIEAGTFNNQSSSNRFIYLSTEDYGSSITINSHSASNWRAIIGTKFGVDNEGNLYASDAVIYGSIYASKGYIGGWQIGTDGNKTLHNGNANTSPVPGSGVIVISKGVAGSTTATGVLPANKTWAITADNKFGVTTDGVLYASGANISGKVTISSSDSFTVDSGATITDNTGLISNNAIEVGGRNLFIRSNEIGNNTNQEYGWQINGSYTTLLEKVIFNGLECLHFQGSCTGAYIPTIVGAQRIFLENGCEYVISCDLLCDKEFKVASGTTPIHYHNGTATDVSNSFDMTTSNNGNGFTFKSISPSTNTVISANTWQHFEQHITTPVTPVDANSPYSTFRPFIYGSCRTVSEDITVNMYMRNWKIEKGNKATNWSPAPEDTEIIAISAQNEAYAEKKIYYAYASDLMGTDFSVLNDSLPYRGICVTTSLETPTNISVYKWEINPLWASKYADNYLHEIQGGLAIYDSELDSTTYAGISATALTFYLNDNQQMKVGYDSSLEEYGVIAESYVVAGSGANLKFDNTSEASIRGRFTWEIRDNGHLSLKLY